MGPCERPRAPGPSLSLASPPWAPDSREAPAILNIAGTTAAAAGVHGLSSTSVRASRMEQDTKTEKKVINVFLVVVQHMLLATSQGPPIEECRVHADSKHGANGADALPIGYAAAPRLGKLDIFRLKSRKFLGSSQGRGGRACTFVCSLAASVAGQRSRAGAQSSGGAI